MDPRYPEQAIARMRELMEQYARVEKDMGKATTSAQLGQLEREGGLVVQEICLVAPRIHEAMMQTSRQRRRELSRGIVEKPVGKPVKDYADVIGEEDIGGEGGPAKKVPEIASEGVLEVVEIAKKNTKAEKKTATKKTTRKKKTAKKADE